jgi:hypothetical protein
MSTYITVFLTWHSETSLDRRCLDQLKALSESTALEVLTKYGEADLSQINSKAGFFMGIVKRFREQSLAADPNMTNQAFNLLPPFLRELLPPHSPTARSNPATQDPAATLTRMGSIARFCSSMSCTSIVFGRHPRGLHSPPLPHHVCEAC